MIDDFDPIEASSLTYEAIQVYTESFSEMPDEAIAALETLMGLKNDIEDPVWAEVINEYGMSTYGNLPKKIVDLLFKSTIGPYEELNKKVFKFSTAILFNKFLSRTQIRRAIQYHKPLVTFYSTALTFRLVTNRIIELGVDDKIQLAILKNRPFFVKVVQVPSVLNALFPSKLTLFKMMGKVYDMEEERNKNKHKYTWDADTLLSEICLNSDLTIEEIDHVYYEMGIDWHWDLGRIKNSFCFFQILPFHKLIEYGLNPGIAWSLSMKDLDLHIPEYTRKNDLNMVSENMPLSHAKKCLTAKSTAIRTWLAVVGPKEILPALMGQGKVQDEFISYRLKGEVNKEYYRKARGNLALLTLNRNF